MYVLITPGFACASSVRRFGYVNRKAFKRLFESGVGAETLVLAMGRFGGYEERTGDHGPELAELEPEEEGVLRETLKKWAEDLNATEKTYDDRCAQVWEYLTDARRGMGMLLAMSYAISSSGMGKVVAGFESTAGRTYHDKLKNLFKIIGKQTMAVYLVCVHVRSI